MGTGISVQEYVNKFTGKEESGHVHGIKVIRETPVTERSHTGDVEIKKDTPREHMVN